VPNLLGIDIGTTFITVYDNQEHTVLRMRHEGRIAEILHSNVLNRFAETDYCMFTGKAGKEIAETMEGVYLDEAVAISSLLSVFSGSWFDGVKGQIIDIGASSLTLYTIKDGKIVDIAQNTLCAAGTGLFLEEQAERLDMDLEKQGELDIDEPPLIASRCTVFAKSDLIHHQQEGRSKNEMWSGLCRSLVVSAVNTLFRGEEPRGKIIICGGVSLNMEVLRWLKVVYPEVEWIIPSHSEALIAKGAAMTPGKPIGHLNRSIIRAKKKFKRMPALTLHKSHYPHMPEPVIDANDLEIRIHGNIAEANEIILGMDIGSTSTKLAVLDAETHEPLLDIYGKTAGDPVGAAKKIFSSFYHITGEKDYSIEAFGTTGSGRKLVGKIFAGDHIVNEISAHARGTAHFFPEVETIFEIGGQDAKYIRLQNGYALDANMNYVCAAGTGSFVEEQARKLGFKVQDIGDITAGIAPPVTSDRCTVFMEQDLRALLKEGFSKEEALASVLYSVIQNYLNRVVGNRFINEKKIYFQGATARNKGLVAALENLLEVEVAVSPFCHLMGAIGAALMAQEYVQQHYTPDTGSVFVGRASIQLQIASRTEICQLCRNFCRINYIKRLGSAGESSFSWGYQCGRDPEEKVRREIPEYNLFKERQKAYQLRNKIKGNEKGHITLIHALTDYTFQPLWIRFFNHLGYRVSISGLTDSRVKKHSSKIASADFCFPVKIALGHMVKALEQSQPHSHPNHYVFFPHMIAHQPDLRTAHSFFCPYVQSGPSIVRATLARNEIKAHNLLSPVVDLRQTARDTAEILFNTLRERLNLKKRDVITAFKNAFDEWKGLYKRLEEKGREFFEEIKNTEQPVFLLVGRPYNLHDRGLNLGIPEKIAAMGYPVIPIDMLILDTAALSESNYHNIFWKYGQRIMAAVRLAGKYRNVFPIYLSNFNCGPDSFLLTFAEDELNGKPMLILELDEHDSDGGYLTRIEAFINVVEAFMKKESPKPKPGIPHIYTADRQPNLNGTVWMPPIHYSGSRLFSASFRGFGFDCRNLEPEDKEALVLGKKYLRGGECLPMTLTLGSFLKQINKENSGRHHILFMPTTEGPCRFGQYNLLDRIVFHRLGLDNVDILSPSSVNTYQGLPEQLRRQLMHAATAADVLFKMRSKVRPYERTRGGADELFEKSLKQLECILEKRERPLKAVKDIAAKFANIDTIKDKKPLVGIVGEIYVRCNSFSNGNLVDIIEANEGEAWLSPTHEWVLYIAYMNSFAAKKRNGGFLKRGGSMVSNFYLFKTERSYYQAALAMLHDRLEPHIKHVVGAGAEYLPEEFEGEAMLTIGRAVLFAREGASMVINAAPFGCMPGTLSSSILLDIKEKFNIPFLSLFYDGDIDVNDKVAALLKTITLEKGNQWKSGARTAIPA
jgi:predicted CoA-substrate-specific enzyme activase